MNRVSHQAMPDPRLFLNQCDVIDWQSESIRNLAAQLAASQSSVQEVAKECFQWVRDNIWHSSDHRMNPVTCRASDTLANRTGFCFAKSHLLCALLRANQIPCGLSYQRLSVDDTGSAFCLHGLCAIYLGNRDQWYRVDPRGNRDGIDAQFTPPQEKLAFRTELPGESDLPGLHRSPLPEVVAALRRNETWDEFAQDLPDLAPSA